jgi:hypothetical protein
MPSVSFNTASVLVFFGAAALLFGFFLLLAGFGIITIDKITVEQGRKTWMVGLLMVFVGTGLLTIDTLASAGKMPFFTAPTPTPYSPGTILLDENFEDGQMQGISVNGDWKLISDETKNRVIDSDSTSGGNFLGFGSESWDNYLLEFRIRFLSTNNQGIGLEFRRTCGSSQDCLRYVLFLNADSINLHFDGPQTPYTPIQASTYNFNTQSWYDVRLEARNSNLKLFINNSLIIEANDSNLAKGSFLFGVENNHVQLDDLRIVALDR